MKVIIILFVVLSSFAVMAQEPITFKGVPFGATVDTVKERFPRAHCLAGYCFILQQMMISAIADEARASEQRGIPYDRTAELLKMSEHISVAGRVSKSITFLFWNGNLGEISIILGEGQWTRLSSAYFDRYGKPTLDVTTPIKTRMGVELADKTLVWSRPEGEIRLRRYFGNITESSIHYTSADRVAARSGDAAREREHSAKDL